MHARQSPTATSSTEIGAHQNYFRRRQGPLPWSVSWGVSTKFLHQPPHCALPSLRLYDQSITLPARQYKVRQWISNPSSSSRSPVSWAEPVRRSTAFQPWGGSRERRLTTVDRLSWWCHPGSRRVPRGPDPFDHPKRQGTRYVACFALAAEEGY